MTTKKLAVVGAGLIGKRHIEIISRLQETELAAIVDPQPTAAKMAGEYNVHWSNNLKELLATNRPDGVVIASPNQLHVEHALQCVQTKTPMLIEKPISDDTETAARLVEAAEAADVQILVGHHRRHNPIIQEAKAKIEAGAIGSIVAVNAMCWLYKPDDYFNVEWRTRKGAGPVFINLIHDIDLLRHLCGEVSSVHAFQSSHTRGHDVEDTAAITLQFDGGALGTVTVSDTIVAPWSWELTAAENPAYPETPESCYLLGGTHGSLEIPTGKIWTNKETRSWWEPIDCSSSEVTKLDPLDLQISHFCRVIEGKEEPLVSGEEGLRTLQVVEAIKRSADSGSRIDLVR